MSEVARIADQLRRAFDGDAWHGPALKELLAGLSSKEAAARPLARTHNVWEIVLHITAWLDVVRQRVQGNEVQLDDASNWPVIADSGPEAWRKAVTALGQAQADILDVLSSLPDSRLEDKVSGTDYLVYFMLHG